jgi:hypothetical protein
MSYVAKTSRYQPLLAFNGQPNAYAFSAAYTGSAPHNPIHGLHDLLATPARRFSFVCELQHSEVIFALKCWTSCRQSNLRAHSAEYHRIHRIYSHNGAQPMLRWPHLIHVTLALNFVQII